MGAIVTVYIDHGRGEPERLLGELARWAESAVGISAERAGPTIDVNFPDSDTAAARRYVEQVLGAANPAWRDFLGLEVVSSG